ncbi:MAG: hypothetical protein RBG13Loki_0122 [Promethearchaeota archaeon CR_4]|nr:MAG: hypothetical protein RBG13Loki_0122 [Candidatus Lokiarchaeota archaeon CR_4]
MVIPATAAIRKICGPAIPSGVSPELSGAPENPDACKRKWNGALIVPVESTATIWKYQIPLAFTDRSIALEVVHVLVALDAGSVVALRSNRKR